MIYSFNSGLKQAVERLTEREMDSLRCSRKKGYFLHPTGQAKDPPGKETLYIQPDPFLESLKKTVLFSTYLVVSVRGHFQRSVIKKAGNFPQIFFPTPALGRLSMDRGNREGGLRLKPAYIISSSPSVTQTLVRRKVKLPLGEMLALSVHSVFTLTFVIKASTTGPLVLNQNLGTKD